MAKKNHEVFNGTRGIATWEGGSAQAGVNYIDGSWLLALRTSDVPDAGAVVSLMGQRWALGPEVTSTVRGIRSFRVYKANPEVFIEG